MYVVRESKCECVSSERARLRTSVSLLEVTESVSVVREVKSVLEVRAKQSVVHIVVTYCVSSERK